VRIRLAACLSVMLLPKLISAISNTPKNLTFVSAVGFRIYSLDFSHLHLR
jgi:hypothetical protein